MIPRSDIYKKFILYLIVIFCFFGLSLNFKKAIIRYYHIKNHSRWNIHNYFGFANYMFAVLRNSETITTIKNNVAANNTIGFYSNLAYGYEFMMYSVLQNLLIPILLDRDNPNNYEYTIMFVDLKSLPTDYQERNIKNLGYGLYLMYK